MSAAAGDVADDVVAGPAFAAVAGEFVGGVGEVDAGSDGADSVPWDAAGVGEDGRLDVGGALGDPASGSVAAESVEKVAGAGVDGGDVPVAAVGLFEVEVVDVAAQLVVAVAQLAVEEV